MRQILLIFLLVVSLSAEQYQNELINSTSPYLQQHASNSIHWLPWGEKAFLRAKKENKAIFLSIGYSTCHWCHVMEKESFENEAIAKVFNEYFICVKVDREEMPHLDSYYQRLYAQVKGRTGGWPLSAFLTHEKKAFYLATYIPPTKKSYHEGLDTLLPKIYDRYSSEAHAIHSEAEAITQGMKQEPKALNAEDANISMHTLSESLLDSYDDIYSGFGRGKKFPEASKVSLMMDLALLTNGEELEEKSLEMLDVMALRGLYDHIDGGFFRYAVDAAWEIPHFEKMLYNQAELIPLYVRAYEKTKKQLYKDIVRETIAMLDKRFISHNLYFSASDADTKEGEGKFFVFSPTHLKKAVNSNPYAKELFDSLDFTINGNFEGEVHLNFYTDVRPKGFKKFQKELQVLRRDKEFPFIDKKINTAWNAMMIEAFFRASSIDEKYTTKAQRHLHALKDFAFFRGELYHQSIQGTKPTQKGILEDYSFFIGALLEAYKVTLKKEYLNFADYLLQKAKSEFYKEGVWYLSNDNLDIKADLNDKYYTSALAKMLQNIIVLASLKSSFTYESLAIDTLERMNAVIEDKQSNAPASATAFLMQKHKLVTLKSSVDNLEKNSAEIRNIKYPFVVVKEEKTDNYLACTMRSCFAVDEKYENIHKIIENGKWK